jgi:hypothetical protein
MTDGMVIAFGEAIPFDDVVLTFGSDFSFTPISTDIFVNTPGIYAVVYSVQTQQGGRLTSMTVNGVINPDSVLNIGGSNILATTNFLIEITATDITDGGGQATLNVINDSPMMQNLTLVTVTGGSGAMSPSASFSILKLQ